MDPAAAFCESGISRSAIQRIENGGMPRLEAALLLSRAFDLTVYEAWGIPAPPTAAIVELGVGKSRVANLRRARNMSIAALSVSTGVLKGILYAFERGSLPNLQNALSIAAALQVSVHDLVLLDPARSLSRKSLSASI